MSDTVRILRDAFSSTEERKLLTVSAVSLAAVYLFCIVFLDPSDDVPVFYGNWLSLREGMLPYVDFSFGNPPLSFMFIAIPGALSWDLYSYYCFQAAEMTVLAWLSVYMVMKISGRLGLDRFRVTAMYLLLLLMYSEELVKKLDMAVALSVLLAVYLFLQRRFPSAYFVLIIGAMIKVYPVVLIPVFIMANLSERSDPARFRNALNGPVLMSGTVAAAFVAMAVSGMSVERIIDVFVQQSGRDFQIESVVGNLLQIFGMLGLYSYEIVSRNFTYNVECAPGDAVSGVWAFVTLVVYLLVLYVIWHFGFGKDMEAGERDATTVRASAAVLLVVLLTFMVFSTQYMLWIITLLPFVIGLERDVRARRILWVIYMMQFAVLLPLMVWLLFGVGEAFAAVSVLVRNASLFLVLLYCVGAIAGRRIWPRSLSI